MNKILLLFLLVPVLALSMREQRQHHKIPQLQKMFNLRMTGIIRNKDLNIDAVTLADIFCEANKKNEWILCTYFDQCMTRRINVEVFKKKVTKVGQNNIFHACVFNNYNHFLDVILNSSQRYICAYLFNKTDSAGNTPLDMMIVKKRTNMLSSIFSSNRNMACIGKKTMEKAQATAKEHGIDLKDYMPAQTMCCAYL